MSFNVTLTLRKLVPCYSNFCYNSEYLGVTWTGRLQQINYNLEDTNWANPVIGVFNNILSI